MNKEKAKEINVKHQHHSGPTALDEDLPIKSIRPIQRAAKARSMKRTLYVNKILSESHSEEKLIKCNE